MQPSHSIAPPVPWLQGIEMDTTTMPAPAGGLKPLTEDELTSMAGRLHYVPTHGEVVDLLRDVEARVLAAAADALGTMEDRLAEHRAWIAQLQTERNDLALTVLDLQDALRQTVCGLTAESALQSDDVSLEEADPQHSLMNGHVTPRLYVPTDTVLDDIGSPT